MWPKEKTKNVEVTSAHRTENAEHRNIHIIHE